MYPRTSSGATCGLLATSTETGARSSRSSGGRGAAPPDTLIYSLPSGALYRTHPLEAGPGLRHAARYTDWNGDGYADYLLGRAFDDTGAPDAGGLDVISGVDGSVLLTAYGQRTSEKVGRAMAWGGDMNGDGYDEIVAGGANIPVQSGPAFTSVYVFSGLDGSVLHWMDGREYTGYSSRFGFSVASGRDLTGDGVPDIVVGAPTDANVSGDWRRGSALVFSGKTGALIWKVRGPHQGAYYGGQVGIVDDFDQDGLADWMLLSLGYLSELVVPGTTDKDRLLYFAGAPAEVDTLCPAAANSTGQPARLWNSGPIGLRTNALVLVAEDLPPQAPTLLVYGAETPALPFDAGWLCVGTAPAFVSFQPADALGRVDVPVDLRSPAIRAANGGPLRAGDTGTFQMLYADGTSRNATPALRMLFPD